MTATFDKTEAIFWQEVAGWTNEHEIAVKLYSRLAAMEFDRAAGNNHAAQKEWLACYGVVAARHPQIAFAEASVGGVRKEFGATTYETLQQVATRLNKSFADEGNAMCDRTLILNQLNFG